LTFDLESGVRVTCDVGYLYAILLFLGLSVLDFGPLMTNVKTDAIHTSSLNAPPIRGTGGIIICGVLVLQ